MRRLQTTYGALVLLLTLPSLGCSITKDVGETNDDTETTAGTGDGTEGSSAGSSGDGAETSGGTSTATASGTSDGGTSGGEDETTDESDESDDTSDGTFGDTDESTDESASGTSDGGTDDGGTTDEDLCADSGGAWLFDICDHPVCGIPNACAAIIPGCDCGPGRTFEPGTGCIFDPQCEDIEAQFCENTGGTWDENSCGHYECGQIVDDCDMSIPGCDCGPIGQFDLIQGCYEDPECPGALEQGEPCDLQDDLCGPGVACCPCGINPCETVCIQEVGGECPPPPP